MNSLFFTLFLFPLSSLYFYFHYLKTSCSESEGLLIRSVTCSIGCAIEYFELYIERAPALDTYVHSHERGRKRSVQSCAQGGVVLSRTLYTHTHRHTRQAGGNRHGRPSPPGLPNCILPTRETRPRHREKGTVRKRVMPRSLRTVRGKVHLKGSPSIAIFCPGDFREVSRPRPPSPNVCYVRKSRFKRQLSNHMFDTVLDTTAATFRVEQPTRSSSPRGRNDNFISECLGRRSRRVFSDNRAASDKQFMTVPSHSRLASRGRETDSYLSLSLAALQAKNARHRLAYFSPLRI